MKWQAEEHWNIYEKMNQGILITNNEVTDQETLEHTKQYFE